MSDRVADERTLRSLHVATGEMFRAGSERTVATVLREAAIDLLAPAATVSLFDAAASRFVPVPSPSTRTGSSEPTILFDDTAAWEAYLDGSAVIEEASPSGVPDVPTDVTTRWEAHLPIGKYGVLSLAGATGTPFDDRREALADFLVDAAEAALARIERERRTANRERELRERAARLDRLNRSLRTLMSVDRSVVRSGSRDELEQVVVDRLLELDPVVGAWIGAPDLTTETLALRTWTDRLEGYDDAVPLDLVEGNDEPAVRTARTRSPVRVSDTDEGGRGERWRRELRERNVRSVLSVPLLYGGDLYGVLAMCSDRPAAFDDLPVGVFEGFAESVAHAINADERRRALFADRVIDVTLAVNRSDDFLSRVAREVGCRVELEGVVPAEDETTVRVFFRTAEASADEVLAFLEGSDGIEGYDHLDACDSGDAFQVRLRRPVLVSELAAYGAAVTTLRAEGDETTIAVELPGSLDLRRFVERVRDVCPGVQVRSRKDRERPIRTRQSFREQFEERLTDRQLEAIQVAAHSGYFEWPRKVNAGDLAEMLDVSQPTFSHHLRAAERKLVDMLFDRG